MPLCTFSCLNTLREWDHEKDFKLIKGEKTHTSTTHEDNSEGLQDPSGAHNPCEPQEQNHTQNVLRAGQEHAYKCAHLRALQIDWHTKTAMLAM